MPAQTRKYATRAPAHKPTEVIDSEKERPRREGQKLASELDDILNEIDSVLEENAEEFVKGYVQKGGQ